ncbi:unnamed protein product, partial [Prorocentrum cordatum]
PFGLKLLMLEAQARARALTYPNAASPRPPASPPPLGPVARAVAPGESPRGGTACRAPRPRRCGARGPRARRARASPGGGAARAPATRAHRGRGRGPCPRSCPSTLRRCSWTLSSMDGPSAGALLEPTPEQAERCRQLREQAEGACGAIPGGARWCEEAELLRYVCARPTLEQSLALFREAMGWRREHVREWADGTVRDGSYGSEYASAITRGRGMPPWCSFLLERMPIQVYRGDQYGLPILYFALGRADFEGMKREVGIDRLRQYVVYCNDY